MGDSDTPSGPERHQSIALANGQGDWSAAAAHLAAHYAVTRILAESATLGDAAERLLQAVCQHLDWASGVIWSLDPQAQVLRCLATWHVPEPPLTEFARQSAAIAMAPGQGIPGRVWASGSLVWIADVPQEPNSLRGREAVRAGLHSAAFIPIRSVRQVLGVLEVASKDVRRPDHELLAILADIGSQIGQFAEHTRAEEELARLLHEAEAADGKWRALLESAPDAIVITGDDGRIVLVNRKAEELFGYQQAALLGQPVEVLIPERFRQAHREDRARYHAAPCTRPMGLGLELYARRSDGSEFPVEVSLSPLASGRRVLVTTSTRDVTERKRVERFQSSVLSSVSHELRTPLTSIKTSVTHLLNDTVTEHRGPRRELLQTIDEETDRLTRLVAQLLAVSRIDGHVVQLQPEWHELGEIVASAVAHLDPGQARMRLLLADALPLVFADFLIVEQIVTNLVENALKYSAPSEPVEVTVQERLGHVQIEVADRGPGVPSADAERIFEKFYRSGSVSAGLPGSGLGLAIARGFAQAHGGDVQFVPRPGGGSVFTVTLPIGGQE